MKSLYHLLRENEKSDMYPFHMPGHKRNMQDSSMKSFYGIDITEINGFDNLHHPTEILKTVMENASDIFGAEETYLLVNGSTGGILSAVSAALKKREMLLLARNSHKSVYHAVYLNELVTDYIYPKSDITWGISGSVDPADIAKELDQNQFIKAVFITSPTYDGVISDVREIARICHQRNIPVIVDEAHGAHFCMDSRFPESAVASGADIVINSIHKTLPALTQTAVLHVQGKLINRERLRKFLQIYQTSSPSYILMAGIDECLAFMKNKSTKYCDSFFKLHDEFMRQAEKLKGIRILSGGVDTKTNDAVFNMDPGKLIISVRGTGMSGKALLELLENRYHLVMEMAGHDYVIAIVTIMDNEEGWNRLKDALFEIDGKLANVWKVKYTDFSSKVEKKMTIYQAMEAKQEQILLEDAAGRISTEFINVYPPGTPLIVPGEQLSQTIVNQLMEYKREGLFIEGLSEQNCKVTVTTSRV